MIGSKVITELNNFLEKSEQKYETNNIQSSEMTPGQNPHFRNFSVFWNSFTVLQSSHSRPKHITDNYVHIVFYAKLIFTRKAYCESSSISYIDFIFL